MALEARTTVTTTEKSRGRVEVRTLTTTTIGVEHCGWPGVRQFLRLQRRPIRESPVTVTVTYAMTRVPPGGPTPEQRLKALRGRWDIENRAFWVFDLVFGEDASRIRTGHAPHVMSVVRGAALNFIRGLGLPIAATLREHAFKVDRLFARLGIVK